VCVCGREGGGGGLTCCRLDVGDGLFLQHEGEGLCLPVPGVLLVVLERLVGQLQVQLTLGPLPRGPWLQTPKLASVSESPGSSTGHKCLCTGFRV